MTASLPALLDACDLLASGYRAYIPRKDLLERLRVMHELTQLVRAEEAVPPSEPPQSEPPPEPEADPLKCRECLKTFEPGKLDDAGICGECAEVVSRESTEGEEGDGES